MDVCVYVGGPCSCSSSSVRRQPVVSCRARRTEPHVGVGLAGGLGLDGRTCVEATNEFIAHCCTHTPSKQKHPSVFLRRRNRRSIPISFIHAPSNHNHDNHPAGFGFGSGFFILFRVNSARCDTTKKTRPLSLSRDNTYIDAHTHTPSLSPSPLPRSHTSPTRPPGQPTDVTPSQHNNPPNKTTVSRTPRTAGKRTAAATTTATALPPTGGPPRPRFVSCPLSSPSSSYYERHAFVCGCARGRERERGREGGRRRPEPPPPTNTNNTPHPPPLTPTPTTPGEPLGPLLSPSLSLSLTPHSHPHSLSLPFPQHPLPLFPTSSPHPSPSLNTTRCTSRSSPSSWATSTWRTSSFGARPTRPSPWPSSSPMSFWVRSFLHPSS